MMKMREQAARFGADLRVDKVHNSMLRRAPFVRGSPVNRGEHHR